MMEGYIKIFTFVSGQILQKESRLYGLCPPGRSAGNRRMPVPVPAEEVELLLPPGQRQLAPWPDQGAPRAQDDRQWPRRPSALWAAGSPEQLAVLAGRHGDVRGRRAHHQRHVQLVQLQGLREEGQQEQQEEQKRPRQKTEGQGPREAAQKPERLVFLSFYASHKV